VANGENQHGVLGREPKALLCDNPLIREIVIPFGRAGYVALFEIENAQTVTVTALRHQREEDYH
jgi:hypothetical protein